MNTALHPAPTEALPSMRELIFVMMLHKVLIAFVFLAVMGAAAVTVFYLRSPLYEASSTVVINVGNIAMPMMDGVPPSDFEKLSTFQTQKDVIKSVAIAAPVVDALGLTETRAMSRVELMRIWVRDQRRALGAALDIERWKKPEDPRAAAIEAILTNLEIISKPESQALKITYRAHDAKEAEATLKRLIADYSAYFYARYQQRAEGMMAYLETQSTQVREKLTSAELAMLNFRRRDTMTLDEISPSATNARAVIDRTNPGQNDPSLVGITDNAKVQDELKLNILAMEQELRKLRAMYSDTTPEVRDLRARIDRYVAALNTLPGRELQLYRLKRALDTNQEVYLHINRNIERARIYAEGGMDRTRIITIVDAASVDDDPVSPKPRLAMMLALVFGAAMAIAAAFVLDYLDPTIRSVRDVERTTGLRVLGSLRKR